MTPVAKAHTEDSFVVPKRNGTPDFTPFSIVALVSKQIGPAFLGADELGAQASIAISGPARCRAASRLLRWLTHAAFNNDGVIG